MAYFLLFTSLFIEVLRNVYLNHFGKDYTKSPTDAYLFNAVSTFGGLILLVCLRPQLQISGFSFWLSVCFALASAMAQYCLLMSMATGSMSYSVLISYLGMLIPTSYSIVCSKSVTVYQLIGLALMVLTIYLGVGAKNDSKISVRWLIYSAVSFISWGLVGLIQLLHQASPYKNESSGFLIWSFVFMVVLFLLMNCFAGRKQTELSHYRLKSKATFFVLGAGVFVGATNKINLYLSGVLPGIVLFPIVNGGVIVLSGIASVLFFKEKLSRMQMIGILIGILSICLLGITK